jgi:hypothetical protein
MEIFFVFGVRVFRDLQQKAPRGKNTQSDLPRFFSFWWWKKKKKKK